MIAVGSFIHLYMQYWYHTQLINKMGFLDKILVTPTHHWVHHAMNPEYMNKNFGQIFMIWDKIFGTFQPELDQVKPIYGITIPVRSWNPFKIDYMHWWSMFTDSWHAEKWTDKLNVWV
jgi:sterol desaturase/sphingolipid hydroxylase (fatty acid hydroxylase superfamily)